MGNGGELGDEKSLLTAGPSTIEYSKNIIKPTLASYCGDNELSQSLKLSEILINPEKGVGINRVDPKGFFIYDMLDRIKLGSMYALNFSSEKRRLLQRWHEQYMQKKPADVFFAPSADEIIRSRTAFGCTHYARAFIAVAKALGMVNNPEDLRYVISCKADDYNQAMTDRDYQKTINGHQFIIVRTGSRWVAINTSKFESTAMPESFSPDSYMPPRNIAVKFESYPGVVFLIRKIGRDYNDDCGDNSLSALMNISRSGDPQSPNFLWERFMLTE